MNVNRVVLTGNLTADPELRPTPSGTPVARLVGLKPAHGQPPIRLASHSRAGAPATFGPTHLGIGQTVGEQKQRTPHVLRMGSRPR